jgi:ABC-type transport system substrate-binding protein
LGKIGINVILEPEELGNYLIRLLNGDFDLVVALEAFPLYADTDSILYPLHAYATAVPGTPYYTIHRTQAVDRLIMEARNKSHELYEGNRALIFMKAMWLIHKDVPYIPLVAPLSYICAVNELENVKYCGLGYHYNSYANVTHPKDKILKIGQALDIKSLDPAETTETEEWHIIRQVYDGLINVPWNYTERTQPVGEPPINSTSPALATSWNHSDDFREWIFSLRRNVTFHDGTPFNASAVAFTFERITSRTNLTSEYFQNNWIPNKSPYGDLLLNPLNFTVSWNETDPFTVIIHLDEPLSVLDRMLTFLTFGIVSPTYVKKHNSTDDPSRLTFNPVGTGPYKFVGYSPRQTIALERNSDYWGEITGSMEKIIFKIILDSNTALIELKMGEVHLLDELLFHYPDYDVIQDDPNIRTLPMGSGRGYKTLHLLINSLESPFNDEVEIEEFDPSFGNTTTRGALHRRVLAYGINRTTIKDGIFMQWAEIPNSCLDAVEEYSGSNSSFLPYPYDPNKSCMILSYLGYSSCKDDSNVIRIEPIVIFFGIIGLLVVLISYPKWHKLIIEKD